MKAIFYLKFIILSVFFISCEKKAPKNSPSEIKQEIEKLKTGNYTVKKHVEKYNQKDTVFIKNVIWEDELSLFLKHFPDPEILNSEYNLQNQESDSFIVYTYTPKNTTNKVQDIEITKSKISTQNIKYYLHISDKNGLNYYEYFLTYEPLKNYLIFGKEGISHSRETSFKIAGEIVH